MEHRLGRRRSDSRRSGAHSVAHSVAWILLTILALTSTPPTRAFSPFVPRRRSFHSRIWQTVHSELPTDEESDSNLDSVPTDNEKRHVLSRMHRLAMKSDAVSKRTVKSFASAAKMGLSGLAAKGSEDVTSVASNIASNLTGITTRTSDRLQSVAGSSVSGLSNLATKGSNDARSLASGAAAGWNKLMANGGSDIRTIAGAAASGLTDLASHGSSSASVVLAFLKSRAREGASAANSQAKALVLKFTGKDDYKFGDISRELIRRAASTEYNLADIMLLLKVLLALGASFAPLAKLLPVTVLLDMLNVSLEARLGKKILEVVAGSLDDRLKHAFTDDEIGDLAKRSLTAAVLAFTGRSTYQPGDIERAVIEEQGESTAPKMMELAVGPEFEEWDNAFRKNHPSVEIAIAECLNSPETSQLSPKELDIEIVAELEEWDNLFQQRHPDALL